MARHIQRFAIGGEGLTLAALIFFALALLAFPIGLLAKVGLTDGGALSLGPLTTALESSSVQRALWNSLESGVLSAGLALVIGTALALLIGLTNIRAKGLLVFLIMLPMMIPPHVTAIAWVQALGPSSLVMQALGLGPEPGSNHPLYSRGGVIALLALQHAPLVFLIIHAALRTMPREMSEAARLAGAGSIRLLRRIILPLLAPSLIAAATLAFVSALGNFGIQALLGIPARYTTLPVLIWQRLASFGPDVLTDMAVIASLLAALAIIAVLMQTALQRTKSAVQIGPPQQPLRIALGSWRPWVEAMLAAFVIATLILPITSLIATALVKTYGLPLRLDTFTFVNFEEVLFRQAVTLRAFVNSTLIAGLAAATLAVLAVLLIDQRMRANRRMQQATSEAIITSAEVTYAIPGLVLSVAFILAFIKPLPIINLSLYGTVGIIFIAYLSAFFSIALKPVSAAYVQLDPSLDDAARVAGARYFRRMTRIVMPMVGPAAASGAILVFLTAYNEVTVSALLWSSGSETIGTTIFNYEDGGYTTLAAAMATITVVATIMLMLLLHVLGRRLPPGIVPWQH